MQTLIITFLVVGLFSLAGAEEQAGQEQPAVTYLTLKDCYNMALKRSEEIAVRKAIIEEAEGRFAQALSGILPRVSFVSSDTRQDSSGGEGLSGSFTRRHIPNRRFKWTQPLFSGFKEFAAIAASRLESSQFTYEKTRSEQLLLVDVSDAFYILLEQRQDLSTLMVIHKTLSERISELNERERLGRSRLSEIANAEAQIRRIEADIKHTNGNVATAKNLLEFLTGIEEINEIVDDTTAAFVLEPEDIYENRTTNRPDVRADEEEWKAACARVRVSRADFFPKVDIEANHYVERSGISKDIDWDVLLTVDAPLFQAGEVRGAVREAEAKARQAKLRYNETVRRGRLDINDRYCELVAAQEQLSALQEAENAAERNYQFQAQDYRKNLVNNLDVLQALKELQEVRRALISADYDVKRLFIRLKVATGDTL